MGRYDARTWGRISVMLEAGKLPGIPRTRGLFCHAEAFFAVDSGSVLFEAIEYLRIDQPNAFLAPVDFACMGYALPAALGAALLSFRTARTGAT